MHRWRVGRDALVPNIIRRGSLIIAWGCCLFTFSALISNATFTSDLWSECGVNAPDLCEGGLSDERIDVPGGDDLESATLTTAITSAVLMFAALFASLSF